MDGFIGSAQEGREPKDSHPLTTRGGRSPTKTRRGRSFEVPSTTLPKGTSAISAIGGKFAADAVTVPDSMAVPISTGRKRFGTGLEFSLSLRADAGDGKALLKNRRLRPV